MRKMSQIKRMSELQIINVELPQGWRLIFFNIRQTSEEEKNRQGQR